MTHGWVPPAVWASAVGRPRGRRQAIRHGPRFSAGGDPASQETFGNAWRRVLVVKTGRGAGMPPASSGQKPGVLLNTLQPPPPENCLAPHVGSSGVENPGLVVHGALTHAWVQAVGTRAS